MSSALREGFQGSSATLLYNSGTKLPAKCSDGKLLLQTSSLVSELFRLFQNAFPFTRKAVIIIWGQPLLWHEKEHSNYCAKH